MPPTWEPGMPQYGNRFFRAIVSLLEWILKKVLGPARWKPAGAIRVLPPSALVYEEAEERRAEPLFHMLTMLGFSPRRVPVRAAASIVPEIRQAITDGAAGCWATVVLEPMIPDSAGNLGPAFRDYAHLHPDVVALVLGPLPSRSLILDRYRHVVTDERGEVAASEVAAGLAHASAARVLHCARLLNTTVGVLVSMLGVGVIALVVIGCLGAAR
jgi:hypothetical protein